MASPGCLTRAALAAYLATARRRRADTMLRSRRTAIDAAGTAAKLDGLQAVVHREGEGAEADPFDDAMMAAVVGVAEALKAEADALVEIEARLGKLARRAVVSE